MLFLLQEEEVEEDEEEEEEEEEELPFSPKLLLVLSVTLVLLVSILTWDVA